jgi:hypothetical protein
VVTSLLRRFRGPVRFVLPELGSFAFSELRGLAFEDAQGGSERMEFWRGEEDNSVSQFHTEGEGPEDGN